MDVVELALPEDLVLAEHIEQVMLVLQLDLANDMLQDPKLLALLRGLRLHSLPSVRLLLLPRRTPIRQPLVPCLVVPSARPCPAALSAWHYRRLGL